MTVGSDDRGSGVSDAEIARIRDVYSRRDASCKPALYDWHLPDVRVQGGVFQRELALALKRTLGPDLSQVSLLDVGCGHGSLLRLIGEWGAPFDQMCGVDLLEDRIRRARAMSPVGPKWIVGQADILDSTYDLVCACTVFSSLLSDSERRRLAQLMWNRVRPGGWLLVFDFRVGNPRNPHVRRVTREEVRYLFPGESEYWKTLLLAPPLARIIAPLSVSIAYSLEALLPFLRTHFFFMVRRPASRFEISTAPRN